MDPTLPHALMLIDVQQGFDDPRWGARNNPHAEHQMALASLHGEFAQVQSADAILARLRPPLPPSVGAAESRGAR